ncbi:MAG: TatD family hydrolase [Gammaproteobacteria bacterium]|nr:TatD family hydrolase [Gammaproteobacteria bacterium]
MDVIDTHCHLDLAVFDSDRQQILDNCSRLGVSGIIVPAIEAAGWPQLLRLCSQHEMLRPALGLHPVFIHKHGIEDIDLLDQHLDNKNIIAVGEIGLDFYIENTDKEKQTDFFDMQLSIAEKHKLPVILHVRKAHDEVLALIKTKNIVGGSCHAFNGSLEQAKRYIDYGFKLGFGGTLTLPNARKIHELAKNIALEAILLETDAPDMSGYQHKGQRNQPDFIIDALNALAQIKNLPAEEVATRTTLNARQLFRL